MGQPVGAHPLALTGSVGGFVARLGDEIAALNV
jgi:hypothetical protein